MEKIKTQRLCLIGCILITCHLSFARVISLSDAISLFQKSHYHQSIQHIKYALPDLKYQTKRKRHLPYISAIGGDFTPNTDANGYANLKWDLPYGMSLNAKTSYAKDCEQPKLILNAHIPFSGLWRADPKEDILLIQQEKEQLSANYQQQEALKNLIMLYRQTVLLNYQYEAQTEKMENAKLDAASNQIKFELGKCSQYDIDQSLLILQKITLQTLKLEHELKYKKKKLKQHLQIKQSEEIILDTAIKFQQCVIDRTTGILLHQLNLQKLQYEITEKQYLAEITSSYPQLYLDAQINQDGEYGIHFSFLAHPRNACRNYEKQLSVQNYLAEQLSYEKAVVESNDQIQELYEQIQFQYQELALMAESLRLAQTSYESASQKHHYGQISKHTLLIEMEKLRKSFIQVLEMQIKYANLVDDFNLKIGRFDESISAIL
ncbi:hypothetical protein OAT84_01440 [Gammaproteobacteria bacterium]|nr:hypothetical protein [Gammaproteobacteria bacterium]